MPTSKGGKSTAKGEIVLEYLSNYPDWFPHRTLGRIIFSNNPTAFKNEEDATCVVRYYRGKQGDSSRSSNPKHRKIFTETKKREPISFPIPESWAEEKKVWTLPSGYRKIGFISDLQVPFQDNKAIRICFDYLKEQKIDCLFINGDLVDFYNISSYERDPRKRNMKAEYEAIIEMLVFIKSEFSNIPIYYNLDANHEARYERYMNTKAPELLQLEIFGLENLLRLDELGYHYIKNVDHVKIGKLPVIHGDTVFRRGSGVSPARTLWMRTKVSCIASHVHRSSSYSSKNFNGEQTTCWTTGMLMHPNVEYAKHVDEYNSGFAIIDLDQQGNYFVDNKKIYKGKVFNA
jgi:hypothetical protein